MQDSEAADREEFTRCVHSKSRNVTREHKRKKLVTPSLKKLIRSTSRRILGSLKVNTIRKNKHDFWEVDKVEADGCNDLDTETVVTEQSLSTYNSSNTTPVKEFLSTPDLEKWEEDLIPTGSNQIANFSACETSKVEGCNYYEVMKLCKPPVHLLHDKREQEDLVIAGVYCDKAKFHVDLHDWLPAIEFYKNALEILYENLNEADPRIVDVLYKLSNAMEQNDVLGRDTFDSEHFETDPYEMVNFCNEIKRELHKIDCYEDELIDETAAAISHIPVHTRSSPAKDTTDHFFHDLNDPMSGL